MRPILSSAIRPLLGRALAALALLALTTAALAQGGPPLASGATEHMVPMRDGVELATNVMLPTGDAAGPWPVILIRTPYGKDSEQFKMLTGRYVSNGYVSVVQDCRGRFRSKGTYVPFEGDFEDGKDTLDWIAKQDFCDGNIGMSGPSAMGITANLGAATGHPNLKAVYAIVAPSSMMKEGSFMGGVFKLEDSGGWMKSQDAGHLVPEYRNRPVMDERWRSVDLPGKLPNTRIPVYNVGGWFDIFAQGNIDNFRLLQHEGKEGARGNQKLLMGPFGHGNLSGDMKYPGDMGLIGVVKDELRWFDHWLKGEQNGIMDEPPVRYYMMASARKSAPSKKNGYRGAEDWPPPSTETYYYLRGNRSLTTEKPTDVVSTTSYDFDPNNPVPTVGGANLRLDRGPMDQRKIPERPDYLRFETKTLESDVVVAGRIRAELYVATDGPDTDFMAKLVDVYPDGYEAILLDSPIRLRFREGIEPHQVKPVKPGEVVKATIDLWSTANTFEAGHRIALHVTSSNHPRFETNPNTGELPGMAKSTRVARNTIHHDAQHASALVLPVIAE